MPELIADCGSSWSKIKNLDDGQIVVCQTRQLLDNPDLRFRAATGHLGQDRTDVYENELVALAQGSLKMVADVDFTVVDIGSRDTKFVRFEERRVRKLDWNQQCGASTGFTLELLGNYYDVDFRQLRSSPERIPVTCGIFAIEKIFDAIIHGYSPESAIAAFVHGIAYNVFNFVQKPETLYVSGGLCENRCFLDSLSNYCEAIPLGRNVLLEGLLPDIE
jgi:activator of 2-hydroxyglutaryl-CoA dehydratase